MRDNQKILLALLSGAAAGAAMGLLFAPNKGKDTRKKLVRNAQRFADTVKETAEDSLDALTDLKDKVYSKMK